MATQHNIINSLAKRGWNGLPNEEDLDLTINEFDSREALSQQLAHTNSHFDERLTLLIYLPNEEPTLSEVLNATTGGKRIVLASPTINQQLKNDVLKWKVLAHEHKWQTLLIESDFCHAVIGTIQMLKPTERLSLFVPRKTGKNELIASIYHGLQWRSTLESAETGEFYSVPAEAEFLSTQTCAVAATE